MCCEATGMVPELAEVKGPLGSRGLAGQATWPGSGARRPQKLSQCFSTVRRWHVTPRHLPSVPTLQTSRGEALAAARLVPEALFEAY